MKVLKVIGIVLVCMTIISLHIFSVYWPFFLFSIIFFVLLNEYKKRKKREKVTQRVFDFPTKELKDEVYEFVSELQIPEEEFHYKWFPSSNNQRNATMHIETNKSFDALEIKKKFLKLSFVEKTFKVQINNLPSYCEYKYQIFIHFKQKEK